MHLLRKFIIESIIQEKKGEERKVQSPEQSIKKYARSDEMSRRGKTIRQTIKDEALNSEDERERAVATIILLMWATGLRVGDPVNIGRVSKKEGNPITTSYGATTLLGKHVIIKGNKVSLRFVGKAQVNREVDVTDASLAQALAQFQMGKDPNEPLFPSISRRMIAQRLKQFDKGFKAKDIRTVVANKEASKEIKRIVKTYVLADDMSEKKVRREARRLVQNVAKVVSARLGNKPGVAERSYINPRLFEGMLTDIGFGEYIGHAVPHRLPDMLDEDEIGGGGDLPIMSDLFGQGFVDDLVSDYEEVKREEQ